MNRTDIKRIVETELIRQMITSGKGFFVPASVSNRHVHLSAADTEALFGKGYVLKKMRGLIQPGQYACEETVTLRGPKGGIEKVRVLGPARPETQAEISFTDSYRLGIEPVVRMSGSIEGTPGGRLTGPAGEVAMQKGVIVAARHLHLSPRDAQLFGLKNGDVVRVIRPGAREIVFGNVAVRAGDGHCLEMHLDTDEANAAGMRCGELLELLR